MEILKGKSNYHISIKSNTWHKDSHSLFDYESSKISTCTYNFTLSSRKLTVFRKKQGNSTLVVETEQESKIPTEDYCFLTRLAIQQSSNFKMRIHVLNDEFKPKKLTSDRLNTNESIECLQKKQQIPFIVVKKLKDSKGQPKGFKLQPGQTIKFGRVQFYISEMSIDGIVKTAHSSKGKERVYANRNVMKFNPKSLKESSEKNACKICLEDIEEGDNYLFNPCRCSGSCGTVHIGCMTEWIHFKVKKQIVGGTQHYNFEKFECEVCKEQLPMIIEIQNGDRKQLLPIDKPESNYLIIEGACEKEKSVVVIKNLPEEGIKFGRGHDCEVRITDISVSRNHAMIKNVNNNFYIFDNKSKFGTLARNEDISLDLSKISQGVQIGRTTLSFDIRKEKFEEK